MRFFTVIAVFSVFFSVFSASVYAESSDNVQVTLTPDEPAVKFDLIEEIAEKIKTNVSLEDARFYMQYRPESAEKVVPYGWKFIDNKNQWHILAVTHYQEHGYFIRVLLGWDMTNLPQTKLLTNTYIAVTDSQRLDGIEWFANMDLLREIADYRKKLDRVSTDLLSIEITDQDVIDGLQAEQNQLLQVISETELPLRQNAVILPPKEEFARILAEYQKLQ